MNTNKELFEDAPVSKAVALMAIPTMVSMLVVVIYNMADTFFIGQTGDPLQVAAVSLATPVFMIFILIQRLGATKPTYFCVSWAIGLSSWEAESSWPTSAAFLMPGGGSMAFSETCVVNLYLSFSPRKVSVP